MNGLYEVIHFGSKVREVAKCRHCSHFHWYIRSNYYLGFCDHDKHRGDVSSASLHCGDFGYRFPEQKPQDYVQLNIFDNEKSI